jgi:putative flippase GtrA
MAGIPAFAAALLTNLFLVDKLHWPKPVAYMLVLCLQMTINFFICRVLVFEPVADAPIFRQYTHFMSGNGAIRFIEWLFYTILVEGFRVHYLTVQIVSIVVFASVKFKFAESLFEPKTKRLE